MLSNWLCVKLIEFSTLMISTLYYLCFLLSSLFELLQKFIAMWQITLFCWKDCRLPQAQLSCSDIGMREQEAAYSEEIKFALLSSDPLRNRSLRSNLIAYRNSARIPFWPIYLGLSEAFNIANKLLIRSTCDPRERTSPPTYLLGHLFICLRGRHYQPYTYRRTLGSHF